MEELGIETEFNLQTHEDLTRRQVGSEEVRKRSKRDNNGSNRYVSFNEGS